MSLKTFLEIFVIISSDQCRSVEGGHKEHVFMLSTPL